MNTFESDSKMVLEFEFWILFLIFVV
jgi:hypothetical protein